MGYTKTQFRIANSKRFTFNGWNLPQNSIYGTFAGYRNPLKYVVPEYPKTAQDTLKIYIWSGIQWIKAAYSQYKKLYSFVVQKIKEHNLIGTQTVKVITGIRNTYQTTAPFGRPHKMSGFKELNKKHLSRANDRDVIWKNNGWIDKPAMTKNIVY